MALGILLVAAFIEAHTVIVPCNKQLKAITNATLPNFIFHIVKVEYVLKECNKRI